MSFTDRKNGRRPVISMLKPRLRKRLADERKPVRKEKEEKQLYFCSRCGGSFLLKPGTESCPSCLRQYADQVTETDTGLSYGGEPLLRRASKAEAAVYYASEKAAERRRKRMSGSESSAGNTILVIMGAPED